MAREVAGEIAAVKSTHLPEVMDFAAFERTFAKKYENAVERIERMAVFEKNLAIIAAHNGEASAPWPAPSPTRAPACPARPRLPGRRKDVTLSIAASALRDALAAALATSEGQERAPRCHADPLHSHRAAAAPFPGRRRDAPPPRAHI